MAIDSNQMELQHLRHLIGAHENSLSKIEYLFFSEAVDPSNKATIYKSAQYVLTKQKLMTFLNN